MTNILHSLKAKCGIHNIALAAKRHSVPVKIIRSGFHNIFILFFLTKVIVCAALYKLSPEFFT